MIRDGADYGESYGLKPVLGDCLEVECRCEEAEVDMEALRPDICALPECDKAAVGWWDNEITDERVYACREHQPVIMLWYETQLAMMV